MCLSDFDRTDSGTDSLAHRWMKLVEVVDRGPWTVDELELPSTSGGETAENDAAARKCVGVEVLIRSTRAETYDNVAAEHSIAAGIAEGESEEEQRGT